MTPREMAKFGQLYLNRGKIVNSKGKEQQIVPESWVDESFKHRKSVNDRKKYGYYWWIKNIADQKAFVAEGHSNQFIFILPDLNSVVVITSTTLDDPIEDECYYDNFLEEYVIRAHHLP